MNIETYKYAKDDKLHPWIFINPTPAESNSKNLLGNLCIAPFLAIALLFSTLIVRDSGTSYIFDRDRNCMTIVYRKWFLIVDVERYSLDTITAVNLEAYRNSDSNYEYVVIQLDSDTKIELPSDDFNSQKIVLVLKQFLNL